MWGRVTHCSGQAQRGSGIPARVGSFVESLASHNTYAFAPKRRLVERVDVDLVSELSSCRWREFLRVLEKRVARGACYGRRGWFLESRRRPSGRRDVQLARSSLQLADSRKILASIFSRPLQAPVAFGGARGLPRQDFFLGGSALPVGDLKGGERSLCSSRTEIDQPLVCVWKRSRMFSRLFGNQAAPTGGSHIADLVAMGFTQENAQVALEAAGGDVQRAAAMLLEQQEVTAAPARAPQPPADTRGPAYAPPRRELALALGRRAAGRQPRSAAPAPCRRRRARRRRRRRRLARPPSRGAGGTGRRRPRRARRPAAPHAAGSAARRARRRSACSARRRGWRATRRRWTSW